MPYKDDGETWSGDVDVHEDGMAENRPGHRSFSSYALPDWVKHPLAHPFSGIGVAPKDYMYAAGDGFTNPLGWSIGHVGAKFGDIGMLEMCTAEELSRCSVDGHTPAHYCVQYGTPWCLQWLTERGADTTTPDLDGITPKAAVWRSDKLDKSERDWLIQALKGELTKQNSVKAQQHHLVKNRAPGNDPLVTERLNQDMEKLRAHWFSTGDRTCPYAAPTQEERAERPPDLPISRVAPVARRAPPLPAALLFPGHGSHYVGMLKEAVGRPAVRVMLDRAHEVLGWSPEELCLNGPEEKLGQIRYCEPVMYLAGLAALELLKDTQPEVVDRPQCAAGLGCGELAAVVCAGALDFEDGLRLARARGEAAQRAAELAPQATCSVAGLDRAQLEGLCAEARGAGDGRGGAGECGVATCLFPSGFLCGGTKAAIDRLCELAQASGALQARAVPFAAAFHTALMRPAREQLHQVFDELVFKMKPPRCDVYLNAAGDRAAAGSDPASLAELMRAQMSSEVLWNQSIDAMIAHGVKDFFEVGPLKQISSMIKRIDPDAYKRTVNVVV